MKELAVSDHLLQCNCTIDFYYFDVLASGDVFSKIRNVAYFKKIKHELVEFCVSLFESYIINSKLCLKIKNFTTDFLINWKSRNKNFKFR